MMKILSRLIVISLGVILLSYHNSFSQTYAETILLFGQNFKGGTARTQGLGGAQTALGGDLSLAQSNPAGLGMFNRSAFTISPSFEFTNATAEFLGENTPDSGAKLTIPHLGVAFHSKPNNSNSGIKAYTFGITYGRSSNFNQQYTYKGLNENSSLIDFFIENATGDNPGQFGENGPLEFSLTKLAYDNFLLTDSSEVFDGASNTEYFTDIIDFAEQTETIKTSGSTRQWNLSFGANYEDKLFFGLGIGLASLRYTSERSYNEFFAFGPLIDFDLVETLDIRGNGLNATLGLIFRPINFIQLGASFTSPTQYYNVEETYSATLSSDWDIEEDESHSLPDLIASYALSTPMRASVGATVFVGKSGFVTADIELVDYSKSQFSQVDFEAFDIDAENSDILNLYQNTFNFNIGGEYRYDIFRFRAGFAHYGNPYQEDLNDDSRQIFSIGAGIRSKNYYVDLAIVNTRSDVAYSPYRFNDGTGPEVSAQLSNTNAQFSVGVNF